MEMMSRMWGSGACGAPSSRTRRRTRSDALRRRSSSGQAMVEFALIAPLFFLLIFGIVEFSLINASVGAFNFAAKDAARLGAIVGRGCVQINATTCDPNVDQYMINNVIVPRVNGVVMAQMYEVEIFDANPDGTCITNTNGCEADIWTLSGGVWTDTGANNWQSNTRNDALSNADYLGVKVYYTYTYLTAFFAATSPTINLIAESIQRIEPQQYGDRFNPGAHVWAAADPGWTSFSTVIAPFTHAISARRNNEYLTGGRA